MRRRREATLQIQFDSVSDSATYLRGLSPHGTTGYGSIRYANAIDATYSGHSNRYYVIAVTVLQGGD